MGRFHAAISTTPVPKQPTDPIYGWIYHQEEQDDAVADQAR